MRITQAVKQALALSYTHVDIVFSAYIGGKSGTIPVFIANFFWIGLKNCVDFLILVFGKLCGTPFVPFGAQCFKSLLICCFYPTGNSNLADPSHGANLSSRASRKNHIYGKYPEVVPSLVG